MHGVLLDQFEELHNGKTAFPEELEAVQHRVADGTRLYILSNSSRQASVALDKINNSGSRGSALRVRRTTTCDHLCVTLHH
jgi:ribonucleotide monophosphatase NagD (HAD superfamily)